MQACSVFDSPSSVLPDNLSPFLERQRTGVLAILSYCSLLENLDIANGLWMCSHQNK